MTTDLKSLLALIRLAIGGKCPISGQEITPLPLDLLKETIGASLSAIENSKEFKKNGGSKVSTVYLDIESIIADYSDYFSDSPAYDEDNGLDIDELTPEEIEDFVSCYKDEILEQCNSMSQYFALSRDDSSCIVKVEISSLG